MKAGILTKPILKGKSIAEYNPEIKKPDAPNTDIKKPIASFLFCGPTGVGKTQLTKVLTE